MKKIVQPTKDAQAHKYKYARLENVIICIKQAIEDAEADLGFLQSTKSTTEATECTTILYNSKGDNLEFISSLVAASNNPQESGKAKTYLKRYALLEIFAISPIGEDDDGAIFTIKKPISSHQVSNLEEKLALSQINKQKFGEWLENAYGVKFSNLSALSVLQYEEILTRLKAREETKK